MPRLTRRFPSAVSPTRPSPRRRRFGTSASSPTSTTASRRWPTGCCSSPASSTSASMRAQYLDRMDIERERGITIKAQNVRLPWKVGRRRRLRPAPDRHPRPRRLHLRGVAGAGGVRGRGAAGRRRPGHRGADAGQPLPGAGPRPAHHPGAQQDRPARRRPGPLRRRDRPHHRLRARRRAAGVRQDGRGRRRPARPRGPRGAAADRRRRRAGPGDDLRLGLRHLPRRGDLRPRGRRQDHPARADQDDVHRRHPRAAGSRHRLTRAQAGRRASASGRSAT